MNIRVGALLVLFVFTVINLSYCDDAKPVPQAKKQKTTTPPATNTEEKKEEKKDESGKDNDNNKKASEVTTNNNNNNQKKSDDKTSESTSDKKVESTPHLEKPDLGDVSGIAFNDKFDFVFGTDSEAFILNPKDGSTRAVEVLIFEGDSTYTGGFNVLGGDVTGDGKSELLVASRSEIDCSIEGVGCGVSQIRFYNWSAAVASSAKMWGPYTEVVELMIAMGDLDGDGKNEFILGPGNGANPSVTVYTVSSFDQPANDVTANLTNYYQNTTTKGVNIATGNVSDNSNGEEILVAAGPGAGADETVPIRVMGYDAGNFTVIQDIDVSSDFKGELKIATGKVAGVSTPVLVVAGKPQSGSDLLIKIYNVSDLSSPQSLFEITIGDSRSQIDHIIAADVVTDAQGEVDEIIVTADKHMYIYQLGADPSTPIYSRAPVSTSLSNRLWVSVMPKGTFD